MKEVADIRWLKEVDSTNNEAIRLLDRLDNLSVIAAWTQTAGRGQRGNSWLTAGGLNLTFSMVLKFGEGGFPPMKASEQFDLTRCVALGLTDYLEGEGISATVKWPNDIYARNRKICGVLIENTLRGDEVASSVVGIGLNVNQKDFPPQLVNPTSMTLLTGKEYDLEASLRSLCACLVRRLAALCGAERARLRNEYLRRLYRFGVFNEYVVCSSGVALVGRIVDVTDSGLLEIETKEGERLRFAFKEISYVI